MLDVAQETSDNMWNRSRGIWPPLTQLVLTHRFPSGRHYSRLKPSGLLCPDAATVHLCPSAHVCFHLLPSSFSPQMSLLFIYARLPRSAVSLAPSEFFTWMPLQYIYARLPRSAAICPSSEFYTQMQLQYIYARLSRSAAICHHLSFTPRCHYSTSIHVCPGLLPSATI
jgi:hypothetical protein